MPLRNGAEYIWFLSFVTSFLDRRNVHIHSRTELPYILESNPHPNLIRTSTRRFLKRKKKLVRGSNLHLSFNRPLPTRQTDSVMSDGGESDKQYIINIIYYK